MKLRKHINCFTSRDIFHCLSTTWVLGFCWDRFCNTRPQHDDETSGVEGGRYPFGCRWSTLAWGPGNWRASENLIRRSLWFRPRLNEGPPELRNGPGSRWGYLFEHMRPRQNGRHFPDDIFKWIFLNENVWISINISLKFVPRGPINNIPALVQIMAWRRPGDKPLSEPMLVRLLAHICVTRPQWVNSLVPRCSGSDFKNCNFQSRFTDWYPQIL